MQLAEEQRAVVECEASTLAVNAFAGTGKTTTLVEYARHRPGQRMMYLAFNRAIKEEAARRFPSHVRCVTTHGLAFPRFGVPYKEKIGTVKTSHMSAALKVDLVLAGLALDTLNNFLASADSAIGETHARGAATPLKGRVVELAGQAWALMCDPTNRALPMPHDGYLKLYQLSAPALGVDTILFDEAQDANPVTLEIVRRQTCGKVFVGDRYQAIYGFRGAADAMSRVQCERALWLSHSWRFGNGIANLAYAILRRWRDCGVPLRGSGPHASIFDIDRDGPHAILARTNAFLFAEAARLAVAGRPFHYAGGIEGYRLDQVLSGYQLMVGRLSQVTDPFMRSFESFRQYREYGEQVDDKEVRALVSVVEEHRHEIPRLVRLIRAAALATPSPEAVTLATAHKAKGLEWMDVALTDDFVELIDRKDSDGRWVGPEREEVNILYVAVTRALRGLALPDRLADWLVRENLYRSVTRDQPLAANFCVA